MYAFKLPVDIGTPVYITTCYDGKPEVKEGKVSMLYQKTDRDWKFKATVKGLGTYSFPVADIGYNVFLDKYEAEKELQKGNIYETSYRMA